MRQITADQTSFLPVIRWVCWMCCAVTAGLKGQRCGCSFFTFSSSCRVKSEGWRSYGVDIGSKDLESLN